MNMPRKFITTLSDDDCNQLLENYQTHNNFRVRNRSHAVLLSFQQFPIDRIATICGVHRNTVAGWIEKWNRLGNEGLKDGERSGRPSILSEPEQEQAVEIALRNPKFPSRETSAIKQETGKDISQYTLKRLLKKKVICGNESS